MDLPNGLRVEPHEDWGIRLVVPDNFFYAKGDAGTDLQLSTFFEVSRKYGFTADNIVNSEGNPPENKNDTFPRNPENRHESMLIRRLQFAESIADLVASTA